MRPAQFLVHAALLAGACLLAGCGGRQEDVPPWLRPEHKPRSENFRGGPVAMLLRHDANHDGILTRQELETGLRAAFAAADTGHTGCLNDAQAAAINQKRQDEDKSTATPLIDWNRDGCIDYREFSAAPYSLFDQLDRDGDGRLTAKEMGQGARKQGEGASAAPDGPDQTPGQAPD